MTIFEFLSVAISIVLALTLGKLVAATPHVFSRDRRDPIHAGLFLVNCFVVLNIWWFVWSLNEKTSWNFLEFLILMGSPVTLYLAAHLLVSDIPGEVKSWREHFSRVHRGYFTAILATAIFANVRTMWVVGGEASLAVGFMVTGILFLPGIFSSRRSVHAIILGLWFLFQVFAVSQLFTSDR
ncbi:MAG: hypothetical protein GKR90_02525 [Pseudomonadales bacterium]|nr:hypothetical protein [Pseudomonadales bacterium]